MLRYAILTLLVDTEMSGYELSQMFAGSVGHWGHIHTRTNQYEAELTIQPVDGSWRVTDLEILLEERL